MRLRNSEASWGLLSRLLHWIMAAVILFLLGLGVYMVNFVPDPLRQFRLFQTHKSWGCVAFALVILRLGWRAAGGPAPDLGAIAPWRARLAGGVQFLLYALLIAMPLSGWISASASPTQDLLGIPNSVFGWFALPDPFVPGSAPISDAATKAHVAGAILLGLTLLAHVTGALGHARDGILARMTFGR